jgi:hypothetical protein
MIELCAYNTNSARLRSTLGGKVLQLQVAAEPNDPLVVEVARYADKGTQRPGIHAVPAPKAR